MYIIYTYVIHYKWSPGSSITFIHSLLTSFISMSMVYVPTHQFDLVIMCSENHLADFGTL